MTTRTTEIEGIGEKYSAQLKRAGISKLEELLAVGCTKEGRESIASRSGIPLAHIENWTRMADLTRVDGIGFQMAELLHYSGVSSVNDLRKRNPENLFETVTSTNNEKHFAGITPTPEALKSFIHQASQMTSIVD